MIQIEGLTPLQKQIADLIWHCQSRDDVDTLIRSMPSEEYKKTAETMLEMIIWATIDEALDGPGLEDYKAAKSVINRISKNRS